MLLADGANAKVVQERLGHHSHSFTADTYQHVMPGMDEAVASQFADMVFSDFTDDVEQEPLTAATRHPIRTLNMHWKALLWDR